jgi:hypothetical protein
MQLKWWITLIALHCRRKWMHYCGEIELYGSELLQKKFCTFLECFVKNCEIVEILSILLKYSRECIRISCWMWLMIWGFHKMWNLLSKWLCNLLKLVFSDFLTFEVVNLEILFKMQKTVKFKSKIKNQVA